MNYLSCLNNVLLCIVLAMHQAFLKWSYLCELRNRLASLVCVFFLFLDNIEFYILIGNSGLSLNSNEHVILHTTAGRLSNSLVAPVLHKSTGGKALIYLECGQMFNRDRWWTSFFFIVSSIYLISRLSVFCCSLLCCVILLLPLFSVNANSTYVSY